MWEQIALGAIKYGANIYSANKQRRAAFDNAKLIREQADFQKQQAYDQATMMNKQGEAFKGSQRSAIASSGVKLDSGSPLALLRETSKNIQQDVSRTRQAGDVARDRGYNQATSLEQQGRDNFTASLLGASTSFAGTIANNVNMPKKANNTGFSRHQETAINNSNMNYADFGNQGRGQTVLPPLNQTSRNGFQPKTWQQQLGWRY